MTSICIGNLNHLFSARSYIAEPASRQAHVRLVKIPVLLRMARAVQRVSATRPSLRSLKLRASGSGRLALATDLGSQAVWNKSNRCAGARGGARVGRPR